MNGRNSPEIERVEAADPLPLRGRQNHKARKARLGSASGVRTHSMRSKDCIANKGEPAGASTACKVGQADKARKT